MPLTPKGQKILASMRKSYGGDDKKAKQVFYASKNAGNITGVESRNRRTAQEQAMERFHESMKRRHGRCPT